MRKSILAYILGVVLMQIHPLSAQDSTRYVMGGDLRVSGMGGMMFHVGGMGITDQVYTSLGGGGGLLIGQSLMLGGYGQGLTNSSVHRNFMIDGAMYEGTLLFGHGGIWTMWSFATKRAVHPFISIQAGWGAAEWTFKDLFDEDQGTVPDSLQTPENKHDQVFVFTPSAGVELNVVRWFRPNIYVGYRMVNGLKLEGTNASDLDGLFGGVSLLFGGFGERR